MPAVDEEEEYECVSVLNSHTQDVKHVVWHPNQEVRAAPTRGRGLSAGARPLSAPCSPPSAPPTPALGLGQLRRHGEAVPRGGGRLGVLRHAGGPRVHRVELGLRPQRRAPGVLQR